MEKETKKKTTKTAATKNTTAKKTTKVTKKATTKKNTTGKSTTSKNTVKKDTDKKSINNNNTKNKKNETKEIVKKETIETKENSKIKKENIKPDTIRNKKEENYLLDNNEMTNFIKIILIVVGIILALYLVTYIINKNKTPKKAENTTKATIQYDQILINKVLDQNKDEYYVLITLNDDKYSDSYKTYTNAYSSKEGALKVYTADLSLGFNSKYYNKKESNLYVSNVDDLKLKTSTLVKVSDGSIVDAYEGNNSIIEQFKSIVK